MTGRSLKNALSAATLFAALGACDPKQDDAAARGTNVVAPPASVPAATAASARSSPTAAIAAAAKVLEPAIEPPPPLELHLAKARAKLVPSSHFDVEAWAGAVSTRTLLDEQGRGAVPVSECRFLWHAGELYALFYAGDLDLRAHATKRDGPVWQDDSLTLAFFGDDGKARLLSVSVSGVIADGVCPADAESLADARCDLKWQSGVKVGVDYDGSLNETGGHDEEWNIQLAIPLAGLKPAAGKLKFALRRCEVGASGTGSCGHFGTSKQPATLLLPESASR